jgi:hypothetical protein
MTATTWPPLTSREVCHLLDLTYRQLDHVSRTVFDNAPGSGIHRRWDDESVDRLTAAKALMDAVDFVAVIRSPWPYLVEAVMAGPQPTAGWVSISPDGRVTYHGIDPPLGEVGISARWHPVEREAA